MLAAYTWQVASRSRRLGLKVDLHVHSYRSKDSLARPEELVHWMARRGLGAMAITDHDAIEGAWEAAALAPGAIIIGEEIHTSRGEIIGLFLQDYVPPRLSPRETIERIHQQGGLVYIPHPTDRVRGSTLAPDALLAVLPQVDLIEGYNARAMCGWVNRRAMVLARRHGLPVGAGSDAHRAADVGLAYLEMPPFRDAQGFLAALAEGRIHGRLTGLLGRLTALRARLARRRRPAMDAQPEGEEVTCSER
jgi:predicted metal-dependent phosphoesterase TrpH